MDHSKLFLPCAEKALNVHQEAARAFDIAHASLVIVARAVLSALRDILQDS